MITTLKHWSAQVQQYVNKQIELARQRHAEKVELARQRREAEDARRANIAAGHQPPIDVHLIALQPGEQVYGLFTACRWAMVEHTSYTTKKKGVIGRAIVGGVLLGPLGALGGAVTSGSRTTAETTKSLECIDQGQFLMTTQRFVFLGSANVVNVPFSQVLGLTMVPRNVIVQYQGMMDHECYRLSGPDANISDLYYQGIKAIMKRAIPENS